MRISLFAVAMAALAGLGVADKVNLYDGTDCSGEATESYDLP
jgi:hypothetical protein